MKRTAIIFFIFLSSSCFGQEVREVCFKETCVQAEIADTPAQRQKGLMSREALLEAQGMLFIFEEEARHGFKMENVNFPLDIIWLDKDGKVVDVKPGLQPCQEVCEPFAGGHREKSCASFLPADKALYVLEVNSGFAGKHKIKIGDTMSINGY
ncbi:MAG TPA: DUF192 domain-containing protein [Candidatus Omnitrophota bacterium]|nr:DUF192 domain-containing protein [Candidatus Omnitrophota bacterium]